jgi:ribosomal protein S18 acetylase RimI-like enzyme
MLPSCADITNLYVAPSERRRGAGRALIAFAEISASRRGSEQIGIGVADDNSQARQLYEQLGYRPSGARYEVAYEFIDETGSPAHALEVGDFLVKALGP